MKNYKFFGSFRFMLALLVLISHGLILIKNSYDISYLNEIGIGSIAVHSFYVISGFIISEAISNYYTNRPISFFINRLIRIFPPYFAAVLLSYGVHYLLFKGNILKSPEQLTLPLNIVDFKNLISNFTAIIPYLNYTRFDHNYDIYILVRYSFAVRMEMFFYLIMFFFVIVLFIKEHSIIKILSSILIIILHLLNETIFYMHSIFTFAPYFLFGCIMFEIYKYYNHIKFSLIIITFAIMILHFLRHLQGEITFSALYNNGITSSAHYISLFLFVILSIAPYLLTFAKTSKKFVKIDQFFGDLSYPLYLNQYCIIVLIYSLQISSLIIFQLIILFILCILIGFLMKCLVDNPINRFRDKIRGENIR